MKKGNILILIFIINRKIRPVSDQFDLLVNSSSDSLHSDWTQTESESPEQFWFVSTVSSGSVQINPQFTAT